MSKVSVILPTYNRAEVLERAIESVLGQTYQDFELIIIDDGSTDSTSALLEKYAHPKILKTKNHGVSAARNLGVEHAKGEWIAFIDSDDQWLPDKLQKQMDFIKANPHLEIVHGDEIWIRKGVRVNPKNKHKKGGGDQFLPSLYLCAISPSVVVLKKSLLLKHGGFREDYPCCEDYDLWLKITSLQEVGYVDDFLINKYGGHEDQLSARYKAMDYWRVKSLDWILQNRELAKDIEEEVLSVLFQKCKILMKGYEKHGNTQEHYREIQEIFSYHFS